MIFKVQRNRSNLFDIIRLTSAFAVMYSHHHAFSGLPEPKVFGITKLGTFAVIVFFSISGFLITKSYMKSQSAIEYLSKRCKRIFPALFVCCFIMIYILCPIFGTGDGIKYALSHNAMVTFVNYITLDWIPLDINGFASDYIHENAINGSLWSLGYEFSAYMLLMLFFFTKRHLTIKCLIALFFCISLTLITQQNLMSYEMKHFINDNIILYSSLTRGSLFLTPFAVGALLACTQRYWDAIQWKSVLICTGIALIFFFSEKSETDIYFYFSIPLIVLPLGLSFKDHFIKGKFDISYGIYIYAYPVQQIVVNELQLSFWVSLIIAALITTLLASLSWLYIEKPFLSNKSVGHPFHSERDTNKDPHSI